MLNTRLTYPLAGTKNIFAKTTWAVVLDRAAAQMANFA